MSPAAPGSRQTVPKPVLHVPVDPHRDHVQGRENAAVTLVEYGDYQCPYCGEAYPIVKRLQGEFGAELRFVFRNFPLTQIHEHAEFAAQLAEAAAAGGKFWEMHDFLYEHQRLLGRAEPFLSFAKDELGLDPSSIEKGIASGAYLSRIRDDFLGGVRSGVNGTPTFYLNGLRHDDSYELSVLEAAIRSAVKTRR
jgi:protein-disulfide isomerase